ncbi:MAG: serine hydrolase domain-containing protein [Isosphaeraceae bacterium]
MPFLSSFACLVPALLALSEGDATKLEDSLKSAVKAEHDAGRFDGVVLVARDDRILGEYAFGRANRAFGAPHRADKPFPVASVTKQFVAVMVLQQVERGAIALDDPLSKHLDGLDRPWGCRVTLRHLLAHTSGLPQPDAVIPDFYTRPDLAPNAVALAKLLAEHEPQAAPDGAFSYNNADTIYLGAVLETIVRKPLADVLRESIAGPLGLKSTGLIVGREVIEGLPEDYDLEGGAVKRAPHQELANYGGAGAAYSTLRDLWAFDRALISGKLLKPESHALMIASSPQSGYAGLGCWCYPLAFEGGATYQIVERHGSIGAYNVVNLYVPDAESCIVIACNLSTFAEPRTWGKQGLAYELLRRAIEGEAR